MGVYFLPFFQKTTLRASKLEFLLWNPNKGWKLKFQFEAFSSVDLRHLEWFLEKMEESRPPLKLKNNGGLLSAIFSENHSKCLKSTLENGQKSSFYQVKFPKLQREDLPWIFGQKSPLGPFHEYPLVPLVYRLDICKKMVKNGFFFGAPIQHTVLFTLRKNRTYFTPFRQLWN